MNYHSIVLQDKTQLYILILRTSLQNSKMTKVIILIAIIFVSKHKACVPELFLGPGGPGQNPAEPAACPEYNIIHLFFVLSTSPFSTHAPVCGHDGQNYVNYCELMAAGVLEDCKGQCPCVQKCHCKGYGRNLYHSIPRVQFTSLLHQQNLYNLDTSTQSVARMDSPTSILARWNATERRSKPRGSVPTITIKGEEINASVQSKLF